MTNTSFLLIAIGLAMDAFAVSISSGVTINKMKIRHALLIASFFGFFQAIMPVFGWLSAIWFKDYMPKIDHWIAFFLLLGVGSKMIYESFRNTEKEDEKNALNIYVLFLLSIATSIDAFAVGISFSFLNISILKPVFLIGIITFILSFIGTYLGRIFGHIFENKLEILGGIVLIIMGIKILIEGLLQ